MAEIQEQIIEGAKLIFKNFSGRADSYHPNGGVKSFSVEIDDPNFAEHLMLAGWNLKPLRTEEGDPPRFHLPVATRFDNYPPIVHLYTANRNGELTSEVVLNDMTIGELDSVEILNCDLVVTPYCWEMGGKRGVKAYLKSMYVTIPEDPLAAKYANVVPRSFIDD